MKLHNPLSPLFFSLACAASLTAQVEPPVRLAFAVAGTAVVDGLADDVIWAKAPANPIDNGLRSGGIAPAPADFSGTFKAAYDAERLYVLIEVTDDTLLSTEGDEFAEVFIDGDYSRGVGAFWNVPGQDGYNDYQFLFGPDNRAIATGLHNAPGWTQPGEGDYPMEVVYKAKAGGAGYVMEVSFGVDGFNYTEDGEFDFRSLPILEGAPGSVTAGNFANYRHIGFEVHLNEVDSKGGSRSILGWGNSINVFPDDPEGSDGDTAWYQPCTFGTLVFMGTPHLEDFELLKKQAWVVVPGFGWHYALQNGRGWSLSSSLGGAWIYSAGYPWLYHLGKGYLFHSGGTLQDGAFFYSQSYRSYLWMREDYGSWAYVYATGRWVNLSAPSAD